MKTKKCNFDEYIYILLRRINDISKDKNEAKKIITINLSNEEQKIFRIPEGIETGFITRSVETVRNSIESDQLDQLFGNGFTKVMKNVFTQAKHYITVEVICLVKACPFDFGYSFELRGSTIHNVEYMSEILDHSLENKFIPVDFLM